MNRVAVLLAFVAAIAGVFYLGWMQNSQRFTHKLSLNLGPIGAWQLANPVSIPVLIASCFGVGFGAGSLAFIGNSMRVIASCASIGATGLSDRGRGLPQRMVLDGRAACKCR